FVSTGFTDCTVLRDCVGSVNESKVVSANSKRSISKSSSSNSDEDPWGVVSRNSREPGSRGFVISSLSALPETSKAILFSVGYFDLFRCCILARTGTGEELGGSTGATGDLCRLSIFSTRDLRLVVFAFPESTTLLLDRENMLRPVLEASPSTLLRLAFDVGQS